MAIDRATNSRITRLENYIRGSVRDVIVDYATNININFPVDALSQIDGVNLALNGKTFLLLGQQNPALNGIYTVSNLDPFTFNRVSWFIDEVTINNARIQVAGGSFTGNFFSASVQIPFAINMSPIIIVDTEPGLENIQANKMDKVQSASGSSIAIFNNSGQVVDSTISIDANNTLTNSPNTIPTSKVVSDAISYNFQLDIQADARILKLENLLFGGVRDLIVDYATLSNVVFPVTNKTKIDGIIPSLDGKTFLLANQIISSQNGIYKLTSILPFLFERVNTFNSFDTINDTRIQVRNGSFMGNLFLAKTTMPFTLNGTAIEITDVDQSLEIIKESKMDKVVESSSGNIAIFNGVGQVIDTGFSIDSTSTAVSSSKFTIPTSEVIKRSPVDGGYF
jgi:hypothetical protein